MKEVYVDGAGSNQKTLCGGWSYVVYEDGELFHKAAGGTQNTTNNRMELTALLKAMEYSQDWGPIVIYCDSAYIVNCFKDGWYKKWRLNGWVTSKKTPVLNRDLWEKIISLYENNEFSIIKIKAHANSQGNILADTLAVAEKKKQEGLLKCQELSSLCL